MVSKTQKEIIFKILAPYHPQAVWVFGSNSRNKNRPETDLNLMVRFVNKPSLLEWVRLEQGLREALGIKVDPALKGSLDPMLSLCS